MKTFMIQAKHEDDDCLLNDSSFTPTLVVEATSAQEAMQRYFDESGPTIEISYIVETIEIVDTDEFRFEITLEQKVKTD